MIRTEGGLTAENFAEWERRERETIANEIKYAPAYAAMLGETRIQAMRAALKATPPQGDAT